MTAHEKGMHRFWGEFFVWKRGGSDLGWGFLPICGRMWPDVARICFGHKKSELTAYEVKGEGVF